MGWLGPINELLKVVGSSAVIGGAKSTIIHGGYDKLTGANKSNKTPSTPAEVNVQSTRLEESKSRKAIRDINQEESNVNKDIQSDLSDLKKTDQEINSINNTNQDSEDTSELAQLELLKELDKTRSELDYEKSLASVYDESNDKKVLELESKLTDLNSKYKSLYLNKSKVDPVKSKSKSKQEKNKNLQALSDKANVEGFKLVNDELEMLRLKQQEDMINLQMKLNQSGLAGSGKQVQPTNNPAEQPKSFISTLMSSMLEYAVMGLVGYVGKMFLNRTATGRGIKAVFKNKIRNLKNNSPVVKKVADFFGKKGAERSASQKAADKARREATKQAARKIEKEGVKEVEEEVGKKAAKKLSIKGLGENGKKYAEKLFGKFAKKKAIKTAEKKVFKIAGKKVAEEALEEAGEKIVTQAGGKALRSALLRISEKIAVRAGTSLSLASTGIGAVVSIGMLAYDVYQIGSSMKDIRLVIARLKELKEDTWKSLVRKNLTIKMINDNEWDSDDLELINSLVGMAKSSDIMTLGTLIFYLEVENLNKIASPLELNTSTSIKDQMEILDSGGDNRGFFTKVGDGVSRLFTGATKVEQIKKYNKDNNLRANESFNYSLSNQGNFQTSIPPDPSVGDASSLQMKVYQALRNQGFSDAQARVLNAEIGRENGFQPDKVFGSHKDPKRGSNLGMISWQGSRRLELENLLKSKGLLNPDGSIVRSEASLNEMAYFIKKEMQNPTYKMSGFLKNKNVDPYQGMEDVGRNYIKWDIDNPVYRAGGVKNRTTFYNKLSNSLGGTYGHANNAEKDINKKAIEDLRSSVQGLSKGTGVKATPVKPKNLKELGEDLKKPKLIELKSSADFKKEGLKKSSSTDSKVVNVTQIINNNRSVTANQAASKRVSGRSRANKTNLS